MADKEIWKDIEGYEGYYQVSNLGRVKSVERFVDNGYGPRGAVRSIKEKILKQGKTNKGYCFVILCKNSTKNNVLVHRVVAKAFIPNPNNLPEINHKSENKAENFVENIEWCSKKYNCNYGHRNRKKIHTMRHLIQMDLSCNEIMIWFSCAACQKETGFDSAFLRKAANGQTPTAYGFKWRYLS